MNTPRSIQRAIVCVANDQHVADRAAECGAYCERRGYELVGIVVGTDRYDAILDMALRRQIEVVVVPSREVLPEDRAARLESTTQEFHLVDIRPAAGLRGVRRLRTRFTRRGGEA